VIGVPFSLLSAEGVVDELSVCGRWERWIASTLIGWMRLASKSGRSGSCLQYHPAFFQRWSQIPDSLLASPPILTHRWEPGSAEPMTISPWCPEGASFEVKGFIWQFILRCRHHSHQLGQVSCLQPVPLARFQSLELVRSSSQCFPRLKAAKMVCRFPNPKATVDLITDLTLFPLALSSVAVAILQGLGGCE
jgi:hypothetical protein